MIRLDEIDQHKLDKKDVMLIIDRIVVKPKKNSIIVLQMQCKRLSMKERYLSSTRIKTDKKFSYSNNFELDGIIF
jgi:excinuclease ABC subunit A